MGDLKSLQDFLSVFWVLWLMIVVKFKFKFKMELGQKGIEPCNTLNINFVVYIAHLW